MTRNLPSQRLSVLRYEDHELIGSKSARQKLLDLFDAADELTANVSLWERDDPDAATALVLWASGRGRMHRTHGNEEYPSIEVSTRSGRSICVYLRTLREVAR